MTGCRRWDDDDDSPGSEPVLTVEQADLQELARLDEALANIQRKRAALIQRIAARKAVAQIEDVIEWRRGGSKVSNRPARVYRGRVVLIRPFGSMDGDLQYRVRSIRKDGTEGALVNVYPWDEPRKAEA